MTKRLGSKQQVKQLLTEEYVRAVGGSTLTFEKMVESEGWNLWYNPVSKTNIRLRSVGVDALKDTLQLQCWHIVFREHRIENISWNNRLLIDLDRFMSAPYFISPKSMWIFGEQDYFQISLYGFNVLRWLEVQREDRKRG